MVELDSMSAKLAKLKWSVAVSTFVILLCNNNHFLLKSENFVRTRHIKVQPFFLGRRCMIGQRELCFVYRIIVDIPWNEIPANDLLVEIQLDIVCI